MRKPNSASAWTLIALAALIALLAGCPDPGADTTAPTVSSTLPASGGTGVAVNSAVTAAFSEDIDEATVTGGTFRLFIASTPITGTVSYDRLRKEASFDPASDLNYSTTYTATLTMGIKDEAGNGLAAAYSWTFITVAANGETTAPTVASTVPANLATGVAVNAAVSATFSEAMSASTVNASNFYVEHGATAIAGIVTYSAPTDTATFFASENLAPNTTYTATVKKEASDASGNAMAADKVWTFTTAPAGLGPSPVKLGSSGNFAILAKTGISTVPGSAITGDIGLSPAAESFMTGFSQTKATGYSTSPQVIGFMYAADMTPPTPAIMTAAISDMETAYQDAAGRITPDHSNLGGGTIGGLTLYPGLYTWGSSVNVTTDITISGAANDVWIFQVSGNLTASSAINVIMSGGARPQNVFWQVAGTATLGTTSHFEGIILCQTTIAVDTGASLNGRIMSQTDVALDQAVITEPAQ